MILTVGNGSFGYDGLMPLYKDVGFELKSGEALAILGVNGSGKTTLLKCMMGFLKWRTGQTLIDGKSISEMSARDRARRIAYVPQAKSNVLSLTAEEMVLLGRSPYLRYHDQPKSVDYAHVHEAMTLLGINYLKEKKCNEMSGGELQMVLIARALVAEPELIVLDEPESNLDFKNQLIILDTLSMLVKEKGIMCIINTHYPEHALKLADKTLMIDAKNKSTIIGETSEIITKGSLEQVFGVEVMIETIVSEHHTSKVIVPLSIV